MTIHEKMNYLTKDELRHIADTILYSLPILDCRKHTLIAIREKVLEMIDNHSDVEIPTIPSFCKKCCQELHNCECKNDK